MAAPYGYATSEVAAVGVLNVVNESYPKLKDI